MIRFQALGVRFSLPLLTLLFPLLAVRLGMQGGMAPLLLALGMHELAHVLAAQRCGVRIMEIRILPFGGSARMENPYDVPAKSLLMVSAAGPAMNLCLAVTFAALAHWHFLSPGTAALHIQHNLVLCLFNLLPALPLDGGRMLFSLLQGCIGESRAVNLCIWLGRLLAALLLLAALAAGLKTGRWNLSFVLAAVFIISSSGDERSALYKSRAGRLCMQLDHTEGFLPLRIYHCSGNACVRDALPLMRTRQRCWFAVSSGEGSRIVSDERILSHFIQNGAADARLSDLVSPG